MTKQMNEDLNPTKPAIVAMIIWGAEYAEKGMGSMAYFDQLPDSEKRRCEIVVDNLEGAFGVDLDEQAHLKQEITELNRTIELLQVGGWLSPKKLDQAKALAAART